MHLIKLLQQLCKRVKELWIKVNTDRFPNLSTGCPHNKEALFNSSAFIEPVDMDCCGTLELQSFSLDFRTKRSHLQDTDNEENVSAKQNQTGPNPWFSCTNEHQSREARDQRPSGERTSAIGGLARPETICLERAWIGANRSNLFVWPF